MAGFDEMLFLEEQQQRLQQELAARRSDARAFSSKHYQARQRLRQAQEHVEICEKTIKFMKSEAPIVLLSEYQKARKALSDNLTLIWTLQQEINALAKKGKEASEAIPNLEARLKEIRRTLAGYGVVVEFKR